MILTANRFTIYFGDKNDSCEALAKIGDSLEAKSLTFLKQVHGTTGYVVPLGEQKQPVREFFKCQGDILLTQHPSCALGVLTADCLPIIFYDPVHHATAIAHAGWRGTVAGVAKKTISLMRENFSTKPIDLEVFFGPSAKSCCYEVSNNFSCHVETFYHDKVFAQKNCKTFFDNAKLNFLKLLDLGVVAKNINLDHNVCTICDSSYHSYRRDGKRFGHQATVVVLKDV